MATRSGMALPVVSVVGVACDDGKPRPLQLLDGPDFPVFGIVGPAYVPLQNSGAFAFFDPIVKDGHATYETAGALGHGERIWIQARLSNDIEVVPGDMIQRYLLLSNTHNALDPIAWTV